MKALVTFYGVSPHLVWPFEIQFILDFFQNLVHGFSEYNSNHLSGSWARMPSKISPRLAVVIPIRPKISSVLRNYLSLSLSFSLLLVLFNPLMLINTIHELTYTSSRFWSETSSSHARQAGQP